FPGGQVKNMCTSAEAVDARLRAGVGVLKAPAAGETECCGAAFDELDDVLGISGDVIAHPELCAAMFGLDREEEAVRRRLFRSAFFGKLVVEIEGMSGVVGRADIEQAGEMSEIVGHDRLL